ncbi:glycoside hydrolase family 38 C-terminal domain-containing protein [Pedobacter sp. PWIIR3]
MRKFYLVTLIVAFIHLAGITQLSAQNVYFIDGYHGGVWGHYPTGYTTFITDQMDKNPFWRLNLEIEPVTWDAAKVNDESGYKRLQKYVNDQSVSGRVEFVNPSYGQSYLFNIQGESVIRQFEIGIQKIREHFPSATFNTYSSEEPCFTSALPQILKSFGYQYASLKNPNTCWGGYTTAFGGELVRWMGSDGSSLLAVPRYASESFKSNSTWQTIAWNNAPEYISGARAQGISNPIGMCIQDAGWKNGPWLGNSKNFEYKTWRDYIGKVADKTKAETWNFNQENVQVSLVWGAQILQRLARNTRIAENKLIMAEKIYAINGASKGAKGRAGLFKTAWENLLLAQHHDSWIVPYNIVDKQNKLNWADQVKIWTDNSNRLADTILSSEGLNSLNSADLKSTITVYNTLGHPRKAFVNVPLANADQSKKYAIKGANGKTYATQLVVDENGAVDLLFMAEVPAMGFSSYQITYATVSGKSASSVMVKNENDNYFIQTDLYQIKLNAAKGGVIESLIAKKMNNKELVDKSSKYSFNEMRGYFYQDSAFYSSSDKPAKITVVENGPFRAKIKIDGFIANHPFTQYLIFTQGEQRIDVQTKIDWQGNPGIGENYFQGKGWKQEQLKKAFYNDSFKLSALFPLNITEQQVYKNSAFDVMKSNLKNTYFSSWDSIKNNLIVNWVDVANAKGDAGMALFTDHTTSYQHNEQGLLALTLQYSGMGLWGRNYTINGPSSFNYSLLPHSASWDKSNVWGASLAFNEPLRVVIKKKYEIKPSSQSLLSVTNPNIEVSSVQLIDGVLLVRFFNASEKKSLVNVTLNAKAKRVSLVELNGKIRQEILRYALENGVTKFDMNIPAFGIRTVKLTL